jgi:hypothetical protein
MFYLRRDRRIRYSMLSAVTLAVRQSDINGELFSWRSPFFCDMLLRAWFRVGGGGGWGSCQSAVKWRAESTCVLFLYLKTKYLAWKMWGWKVQFEPHKCSLCDKWRHIMSWRRSAWAASCCLLWRVTRVISEDGVKAATHAPFWSPSCLCSFKTEGTRKMEHDDGHRRSFLLPVFLSVVA